MEEYSETRRQILREDSVVELRRLSKKSPERDSLIVLEERKLNGLAVIFRL
jgi:hypothetical protein